MIYLDLETTGLDNKQDEILQIGILSEDGKVLMNQYIKPVRHTEWIKAEEVHGISYKAVSDCPTLEEIKHGIVDICKDQDVVIYNADYDTGFLPSEVRKAIKSVSCAMLAFAEVYGDWDDFYGGYRWKPLTFAASYVEHDWGEDLAHDAISDCRATKSVWEFVNGRLQKNHLRSYQTVLSA